MKKLALFLLLSTATLFIQANEKVNYQFLSGDFAPYSSSTSADGGIATRIVSLVVSEMGDSVEVTYLPWRRGHLLALKGNYFAIYPYSFSAQREKEWRYSDALYHLEERIFVRASQPFNYQSDEDLHDKSICRPQGYNLFGLATLKEQGLIRIEQPSDLKACFLMLNIGRVDAILINPSTGMSLIESLKLAKKDFIALPKAYRTNEHHLIISKVVEGGETFLKSFNKQLKKLKQSGEIERILHQSH